MLGTPIQVLIVEDYTPDLLLIREALQRDRLNEFSLATVSRLEDALQRLHQTSFDVVLLNLDLPDSQGLATFESLHSRYPDLPVVIFSDDPDEQIAIQAMRAGADDCLVKNLDGFSGTSRAVRYAIERKRSKQTLRESAEQFRDLFEHSGAIMLVIEPETGRIMNANRMASKFYGYSHAQLVRMNIAEINQLPPPKIAAEMALAKQQKRNFFIFPHRLANGETRTVEVHSHPLKIGDKTFLYSIIYDITERQQVEATLHASEIKYRTMYETMPSGIIYQDPGGQIIDANPAAERILGVSLEQMRERTTLDPAWRAIYEDGSPYPNEAFPSIIAQRTGQPAHGIMGIYNPQSQEYRWISIHAIPQFRPGENSPYQVYATFEDITALKHTEQALRLREEQYRSLVEGSDAMIAVVDAAGKIHYINEKAMNSDLFPSEVAVGHNIREILSPEWAARYIQMAQSVVEHNHGIVVEIWVPPNWYRASIQPLHDASGQTVLVQIIATDITPLKNTQQELEDLNRTLGERVRERAAEVQDLYEHAPCGYHSLDTNGNFVMINQTELDWLGYEREEVLGRPFHAFITEKSLVTFRDSFPALKRDGRVRDIEFEYVRKDGSIFPVLVSATAILNDAGEYIMSRSTVFDNTGRIQAEQALRQSEETYRALFDNSNDGIFLFSPEGEELKANRKAIEMFGYRPEDYRPHPTEHRIETTQIDDAWKKFGAVQRGEIVPIYERTFISKNGQPFEADVNLSAIRDASGKIFMIQSVVRDITQRKQAEEALRRANLELERAIRMKDEFLASMSHELRTPLTGILGLTEILDRGIYGPMNEKQINAIRIVEESGRHLLNLINDILDLSKIEAGKLNLETSDLNVSEVCQASLRMVTQMAAAKHQTVSFSCQPAEFSMVADSRRLRQILVNLLGNAIKFTPEDGELGLDVRADAQEGLVHFTIWDNGIGIAADDLHRLFQPFVQLDGSLARTHGGTGLGLSLVRRLVELHQGSVSLESTPDVGSRFTVSLPWQKAAPPPEPEPELVPVAHLPDGEQPVILLVEDNEINILLVTDFLEALGYNVVVAHTGVEALQMALETAPRLILMDIQLPEINGIEVIRRIRKMDAPAIATAPIIALTAMAMAGDREACLQAGANDYLSKPVNLEELAQSIRYQIAHFP